MQDLAIIFMLLSLGMMVAGVIGLLKGNIRLLKVKNRKQSGLIIFVSFVLCIGFASFVPQETNADQNTSTSTSTTTSTHTESFTTSDIESNEATNGSTQHTEGTDHANGSADGRDSSPSVTDQKTNTVQSSDQLEVHYIDVGQGASQLIIAPNGKSMLIDAGNNDDEQRVVSYVKDQGIDKIDILIVTHPDADHSGGADAVIDAFEIGAIYMPKVQSNTKTFESVLTSIDNKNLSIKTAKAGLNLDLDEDLTIRMLGPVGKYSDANDMSAVVRLEYGDTSFLFTGDAECESERDMLDSGTTLKSDVLLVGHHGSNSSTTEDFLRAVDPDHAVIQVGDNQYGHPTDHILKRLQASGAKIYRNDKHGHIVATSDGKKLTFNTNPWAYAPPTVNQPPVKSEPKPATPSPTNPEPKPTPEPVKPAPKPATPPAQKAESIKATATIDNETPQQNESLTVKVHVKDEAGKPVQGAQVTLTLAYKSKDTVYSAVTGSDGIAVLTFKIGRAAKGFTVIGDISVQAGGKTAMAQTSFTPQ